MMTNVEVGMRKHFTLEYWQDEAGYVGRLKEIPGVFSQGETLDDLKANILDAYSLVLEESKQSLPENVKSKVKRIQLEL